MLSAFSKTINLLRVTVTIGWDVNSMGDAEKEEGACVSWSNLAFVSQALIARELREEECVSVWVLEVNFCQYGCMSRKTGN